MPKKPKIEEPKLLPNGEPMGGDLPDEPEKPISLNPEQDQEDGVDEFDIRATALETEIEKKYPTMLELFRRLAYEITVIGMKIQEACIIVGIEYEKLRVMMDSDPLIERLIKTKDLEYKRKLLKTVSIKAKTDDRLAMGLLAARYPDEFNPRKGSGGGDGEGGDDLLGMAIEFVQKSGDSNPLVTEKSAKITVVKRSAGQNEDIKKRISEILK